MLLQLSTEGPEPEWQNGTLLLFFRSWEDILVVYTVAEGNTTLHGHIEYSVFNYLDLSDVNFYNSYALVQISMTSLLLLIELP